jgi:hypothetical protein
MRRPFRTLVALFFLVFLLATCGTVGQLGETKKHWNDKDYEWIANREVECKASDEGCNQMHLIKGDSCYRLAKADKEPQRFYQCAFDELQTGIDQTKEWKPGELDLNRSQTYENLCESTRNLQDLKKGAEADEMTKRLVSISQAFLAAEPGNLAGIYYLNSARFTMLGRCLVDPGKCPSLCENLKATEQELEKVMSRAEVSRYIDNYHRLISDIRGAQRLVPGCQ